MTVSRTSAPDWPGTLRQVEQALAGAIAQMQAREAALTAGEAPRAMLLDLKRFFQFQETLDGSPQRAGERLAALDASLRDGEDALRQWLGRAESLRRQLAAGLARA